MAPWRSGSGSALASSNVAKAVRSSIARADPSSVSYGPL